MTTARVIVTRPEPDAGLWVQQLVQAGISAEAFALIDIAPLSEAADVQALNYAWQALDDYAACMFVSGHAVTHFFKQKMPLAQVVRAQAAIDNVASGEFPGIPPHLRFMAPGPGTVAALRAAGVPAAQIDAPAADAHQFDSEALWQVIGARDWQSRRVLVVRGQSAGAEKPSSGRDWIARQWQDAGASVDFVGVYQRRPPLLTDAQVARARQASADGSVWLFSSSEAVAHLLRLAGLQGMNWHRARAIATHPRIAQAVCAAGWGVVVESRPALQDIRQALGSIELQHP
ncbi:uroporphyrinogen-III synthase [Polaromonas sp. CG_9.11]|uniref:uroporphyrinogen-III synthase n=1 Tax=Polaromonas sp. CG_9.11 TaxID=2787730 RepID=UPI0018CAC0FC|nr:uroporphyrinogen-III synthase [Polaromonas sp. CG_9.11]MBG6077695.1 uroporphyrinogen-III synthase [Polaromonas sp. CG_9.11]